MTIRITPSAFIPIAITLSLALAACGVPGHSPARGPLSAPDATAALPAAGGIEKLAAPGTPAVTEPRPVIAVTPATTSTAAAPVQASGQVVLAAGLPNPDDLTLAPDGSLYISDVSSGTVQRRDQSGKLHTVAHGLREPEGIIVLPDGGLVVAEQGRNRLLRVDPETGNTAVLLQLTNRTAQDGVDGITLDSSRPGNLRLIVPDSPNGTVLGVSLDGRQVQVLGRGFARPVGAWVEAGGTILIADEFGNALQRLHRDGTITLVARLPQPDDVVADDQGHVFANTLVDGAVHEIAVSGGRDIVLAHGLAMPQGLAIDDRGNLVVTDSGHGRVLMIVRQQAAGSFITP